MCPFPSLGSPRHDHRLPSPGGLFLPPVFPQLPANAKLAGWPHSPVKPRMQRLPFKNNVGLSLEPPDRPCALASVLIDGPLGPVG